MGVSGRAILAALLAGTSDPAVLAELAKGKLRKKRAELERALSGRVGDHHRLLLTTHLAHVDFLDEQIAQLSAAIAERLGPLEAELARLDTIPGLDRRTAEVLLAEIGADRRGFRPQGTWPRGRACARATTRARASARAARPARGASGCAGRWCRRPTPRRAPSRRA